MSGDPLVVGVCGACGGDVVRLADGASCPCGEMRVPSAFFQANGERPCGCRFMPHTCVPAEVRSARWDEDDPRELRMAADEWEAFGWPDYALKLRRWADGDRTGFIPAIMRPGRPRRITREQLEREGIARPVGLTARGEILIGLLLVVLGIGVAALSRWDAKAASLLAACIICAIGLSIATRPRP